MRSTKKQTSTTKVIGIAGSDEKVEMLKTEFGLSLILQNYLIFLATT